MTNIESSAIHVNPNYTGSVIDPNDIAIIHLSRVADPWMTRYGLYTQDPLFQPTLFVGFGLTGNGNTGGVINTLFNDLLDTGEPIRRLGLNSWDSSLLGNYLYDQPVSPILLSDFDDGSAANNTICQFWGGSVPAGVNPGVCSTGFGLYEVGTASGDSGGPGFIWDPATQQWEIAGVTSFGSERCYDPSTGDATDPSANGTCPAGYQLNTGYFGAYAGEVDPAMGGNLAFIYGVTPEPSSFALIGTGLLVIVPMIRRRRRA